MANSIPFFVWFFSLILLDSFWLWFLAKSFYAQHLQTLMRPKPYLWAWIIVWLCMIGTLYIFVVKNATITNGTSAALYSWLLGLSLYLVYNFTNLFAFKGYTLQVALVDTLWGVFLMTIVGSLMRFSAP